MEPSRSDLPLELVVRIPRASIIQRTSTRTSASPTQLYWEIFLVDLLQQFARVLGDVNLGHRDLVQPGLDDLPNPIESPRRIYDIEFAHAFGVAILTDGCCLHHVVLDLVEVGQRDVVEIEDRAGRFHGATNCLGAGGETVVDEFLVFVHQSLELTLWGGDLVEGFNIEETQPLDVYRSTFLNTPNHTGLICRSAG